MSIFSKKAFSLLALPVLIEVFIEFLLSKVPESQPVIIQVRDAINEALTSHK